LGNLGLVDGIQMTKTESLARYDCYGKDELGHDYTALCRPDADGEWVRYDEAHAEIERLTRERADAIDRLAPLGLENERLRAALTRIAQMTGHNISTMARKVASTALSEQVEPSCTCWHQGENGPRVATSKDCPVHGTK
jgi:adenine-specific DNA methylase